METKIKKAKKRFDTVKVMREIREKISLEIMNMTYEEEQAYLDRLLKQEQIDTK